MQIKTKKLTYRLSFFLLFFFVIFNNFIFAEDSIVENADDLCYEDAIEGGSCMNIGSCRGGYQCSNKFPLKNISNNYLDNVQVIYEEDQRGGHAFGNCKIKKSGTCSQLDDYSFGPFGLLGSVNKFNFANHFDPNESGNSAYVESLVSGACMRQDNLYATYTKNGTKYRGKLKKCKTFNYTCSNPHAFKLRKQFVISGDLVAIGNSNICADVDKDGVCDANQHKRNDVDNNIFINHFSSSAVSSEPTSLLNTSSATLSLPSGAKVKWAGLYWQGSIWNFKTGSIINSSGNDSGNDGRTMMLKWDSIALKTPMDSNYVKTSADEHHYIFLKRKYSGKSFGYGYGKNFAYDQKHAFTYNRKMRYEAHYQGFVDLTKKLQDVEKAKGSANGKYWVGDIQATVGKLGYPGVEAAWSLMVVYALPNANPRSIAINDGYVALYDNAEQGDDYANDFNCPTGSVNTGVYGQTIDFDINGFLTPKQSGFDSDFTIFLTESDPDSKVSGKEYLKVTKKDDSLFNIDGPDPEAWNYEILDKNGSNNLNRDPAYIYPIGVTIKNYHRTDALSTEQTSTTMHFSTDTDKLLLGAIGFATDLRSADLCYDYTYGQNASFQNAPSIKPVRIDGKFNSDPIDVKLYFKNKENSDVSIRNLKIDIDPIDSNTSYKSDSTYVTKPKSASQEFVSDLGRDTGLDRDNEIPIGDVGSLDYFYTYYSLNHTKNEINATINASLSYDLSIKIDGKMVDLGQQVVGIENMSACQNSFHYLPVRGEFNIVQNGETNGNDYYFNLPTQVVNRVGNYKVEAMDPDNLNHSKELSKSTIVAVEMLDITGFHYATATCTDQNASVASKKRAWVIMNANAKLADLDKATIKNAGFFNRAIQNAAFRISYNSDTNGTLLTLDHLANGNYKIENFTAGYNDDCAAGFTPTTGNNRKIVTYCGSNGQGSGYNGMNKSELDECMECIYGIHTKVMCSRDNFSIRPEAFSFQFTDYNHSNPSQTSFIADNNGSTIKNTHLAAGYDYLFSISATDHLNSPATPGYTTSGADVNMTWQEPTPLSCNNENNITIDHAFVNGIASTKKSWNNIGKYKIAVRDTKWTVVDTTYLSHHISPYFKSGADCRENSSIVQDENLSLYNGCNISSLHYNTEHEKHFQDMNVTYHPYKFNLVINASVGTNRSVVLTPNSKNYIYYSDISNPANEQMAYHLDGTISAEGQNGVVLSNFVKSCYSVPLDLEIATSHSRLLKDANNHNVSYLVRFHDLNASSVVQHNLDLNGSSVVPSQPSVLITTSDHFLKSLKGKMSTQLNLNYKRVNNIAINPFSIKFMTYKVKCDQSVTDCTFHANLTTMQTEGQKDLNNTIYHYYGRTHISRKRFVGQDGNASLYYEIYCSGNDCNKSLLPDGLNSKTVDDSRWFTNTHHTAVSGLPGDVNQKTYNVGHGYVTQTRAATGNAPDYVELHYNKDRGYPYKTTMENNASNWLIYAPYDAGATKNEFDVEFINPSSQWAGQHETNTSTKRNAANKTNRRTMW